MIRRAQRDLLVTLPKSQGGLTALEEKKWSVEYAEVYWEFKRKPKYLLRGLRLFIACEGKLRGSFLIDEYEEVPNGEGNKCAKKL